ncbi:9554_t:CDS:2 [Entrophospora sp. SA101]|nr:9554_t:CDS:2 [Entrophospora sp. SA101]
MGVLTITEWSTGKGTLVYCISLIQTIIIDDDDNKPEDIHNVSKCK